MFYLLSFQENLLHSLLRTKLNFNILKNKSIAVSSVIIVRDLYEYFYARIIDDITIFP